jgi:hypothetical protein
MKTQDPIKPHLTIARQTAWQLTQDIREAQKRASRKDRDIAIDILLREAMTEAVKIWRKLEELDSRTK